MASGTTTMRDATSEAAAWQRVVVVKVVMVFSIVSPKIKSNGVKRGVGCIAEMPGRCAASIHDTVVHRAAMARSRA